MRWWFRRRPGASRASAEATEADTERFHRAVMACIEVVGRGIPEAGKEAYSMQVFTVALTVQLGVAAARCLREGYLTKEQMRRLLQPVLESVEGGGASAAGTASD